MDNINKGIKYFNFFVILIVLCCCSTQNKYSKSNNIVKWQNNQFVFTNNFIETHPDDFVSLGFGYNNDLETARKNAKLDAQFNLPSVKDIFIESVTMVYKEQIINGKNTKEIDELHQLISGKSNFNVKARNLKYKEIDYTFINNEWWVAMNAIVNKSEYYKDYVNHVNISKSEKIIEFDKQVRKKFNELSKKKEKYMNK